MNRRQAGFFALGVLLVAVAIVIAGGLFDRAHTPGLNEQAVAKTVAAPGEVKSVAAEVKPQGVAAVPAIQATGTQMASAATGAAKTQKAPSAPADASSPAAPAMSTSADVAAEGSAAPAKGAATAEPSPAGAEVASLAPPSAMVRAATGDSAGSAEAPAKASDSDVPAFDVLRVEPDGSTVIAGHAAPHARIDIMSDGKAIASTEAGQIGDFVAVLDKPLAPGNYQLTLKATGKGGVKISAEVATVSVPKDKGGDLLAMVSKPGAASRIIVAPKPAAEKVGVPAEPANVPETKVASLPAESPMEGTTAAGQGGSSPRPASAAAVENPGVRVDAVEVEGDKLYVAGAAKPGSTIRVYADDGLIGQATASKEGRFVVNGDRKLAVGNHIVRADLVNPATGKVTLRATVPFDRPEGADFAAVSPQQANGAGAAAQAPAAAVGVNGGPRTIKQQPLTASDGFVIIRRGDTLWQIARREYGHGIRYTTIYLANSTQIQNPNLILPGQVFDLPQKPQKPIEQAWKLHHELLSQGK